MNTPQRIGLSLLLWLPWAPGLALAQQSNGHHDPIAPVILGVTGILTFALIGRYGARRLGQPSVLGELIMGVIAGNVFYWLGADLMVILREGTSMFDMIEHALAGLSWQDAALLTFDPATADRVLAALEGPLGADYLHIAQTVDVFSRYGVIFLLFLVGLETSVDEMKRTGAASMRVAVMGVILPFAFGFVVTRLTLPSASFNVDIYVAATLTATSVGITARVLRDLHRERSIEAQIILGAAVIDDVLGLLMLAIVSGIVVTGSVDPLSIVKTIALAVGFLAAVFLLGPYFLRSVIRLLRQLDLAEAKLFVSFIFVMVLAWFANLMGLATIVGAFAAGLILHDAYFYHWGDHSHHTICIKDLLGPLEAILVPIFFVLMGLQVKLETFLHWDVVALAGGLLIVAVIGKVLAGQVAGRGLDRLAVGIGMTPRGEVGLIFASIGKSLGVITDQLFSAVVLMVIITTLITPVLLKLRLGATAATEMPEPEEKTPPEGDRRGGCGCE